MTDDELSALRAAAEAAQAASDAFDLDEYRTTTGPAWLQHVVARNALQDAANPATMLRLLAHVEALTVERDEARRHVEDNMLVIDRLILLASNPPPARKGGA